MDDLSGRMVLVTGGAGFIGTHLTDALLRAGAGVRILDNLDPQSHEDRRLLRADADFIEGDVADPSVWPRALDGVTDVAHLAAVVGVGQSMYEITRYCQANVMGTAAMLEALIEHRPRPRKLLVASSMSVYGEGLYRCEPCQEFREVRRLPEDLRKGRFEPACPACGSTLSPLPTPEWKTPKATSVYALNKLDQEALCLTVGGAYGIATVATRFFNVYGPGQSLKNPYTGVAAIFASRLLGGEPPLVFEDGQQSRDFIHVRDLADACVRAIARDDVFDEVINIGTGTAVTIAEIADGLREHLDGPPSEILRTFRAGDIRHCFADSERARNLLGWAPQVELSEGLKDLAEWQRTQQAEPERVDRALGELRQRGLVG